MLDRLMRPLIVASYVAALLTFLASLVLIAQGTYLVGSLGYVSSVSLGSVAVLYAFAQSRFREGGYSQLKSMVLGLLFANAFLQTFELFYGLTFGLGYFLYSPIAITGPEVRSFLVWVLMISPILLVYDQLKLSVTSLIALLLTAGAWVLWILYGYPQYYLPGSHAFNELLKSSDMYSASLWLNFGSKALMASFFFTLLQPRKTLKAAFRRPPAASPTGQNQAK